MAGDNTVRVAVWGATGYAGQGCVRLLLGHPSAELVAVGSRSQAGLSHAAACAGSGCQQTLSDAVDGKNCDVVITASEPGDSARRAGRWLDEGAVVLDLAPDFRLKSAASFEQWYGMPHPAPELLPDALLALPELHPEGIATARLLALPGCFSTAALLALGPALSRRLVEPEVVVDGKTGISGAGRSAKAEYLFSELNESTRAYSVAGHRHQPEIEQALTELGGEAVQVTFVPHLVPMTRGVVATCYLRPRAGVTLEQVQAVYREQYLGQPFVRLTAEPVPSKQASNTNLCFIHLEQQGHHLVVTAVLDNLGRGASSQAIQVLNLRFGLAAEAGLGGAPQWP